MEAVEKDSCAFGLDAIAGEGGDEQGDGDLNGFGVFDRREIELDWILGDAVGEVLGDAGGRCGWVEVGAGLGVEDGGAIFEQAPMATEEPGVKVAEGGEAERRRLAALSVGFDMAADCGWHFSGSLNFDWYPLPPAGVFWGQVKWMQWFSSRVRR